MINAKRYYRMISAPTVDELNHLAQEFFDANFKKQELTFVDGQWVMTLVQTVLKLEYVDTIHGRRCYVHRRNYRKSYYTFVEDVLYTTSKDFEPQYPVDNVYSYTFDH